MSILQSEPAGAADPTPWRAFAGFFAWVLASLAVVAFFVLSPELLSRHDRGLRLGVDWPMHMLADPGGRLTVDEVAALPDSAFKELHSPLNGGYSRDTVFWLRMPAPAIQPGPDDPLWLEILPPYLDEVTLYQPGRQGGWRAQQRGDLVPRQAQHVRVRQLLFPLAAGQPAILRVDTRSSAQVYGGVWRSSDLMEWLSSVEWAWGVHLGINLVLALFMGGAALALRLRSLTAMAVMSAVVVVHGANVQGYLHNWLPGSFERWADLSVSVGIFFLPASLAWQVRELLTAGTRWRRIDKALLVLCVAPLLAIASIPLGLYHLCAPMAVSAPWLVCLLAVWVTWNNLRDEGLTRVGLITAIPYTLHVCIGVHVAATYIGWTSSFIEAGVFWQLEMLLLNVLISVAVGLGLVERVRASAARQAQLVRSLAQSEQVLEERVRQRTTELDAAQAALQAALQSERDMRMEQRQFFNMVNHEFRTPLAVVDSAASEQQSFPSADLGAQVARAAQIRRACRRLATLVDNCLVSDRLDTESFRPRLGEAALHTLVAEAAQLVEWSPRHRLVLACDEAPALWVCDATLVQIALSTLVDNAVKYAQAGAIYVTARLDGQGWLHLLVEDQGPGLLPEVARNVFEWGARGERTDQQRGFGLGLWVARRIVRLHGGDAEVSAAARGGTCFRLRLPPLVAG